MRNQNYRFLIAGLTERFQYNALIQGIQIASGLIEEQEGRIMKKNPGDADPLLFSA